jgi:hypothetical protein
MFGGTASASFHESELPPSPPLLPLLLVLPPLLEVLDPPSSPPLLLVLLPLLEVLDPPPSSPELPELLVLPEPLPLDVPPEEPPLEVPLPEEPLLVEVLPVPEDDPELPPLEPPEPAPLEEEGPESAPAPEDAAWEHPAMGPAASNPDTMTNGITLIRGGSRKARAPGIGRCRGNDICRDGAGNGDHSPARTVPLVLDRTPSSPVSARSPRPRYAGVTRAASTPVRRAPTLREAPPLPEIAEPAPRPYR